ISKLEQEILDIRQQYTDKKKELELQLIESFENLTASISSWDHQFVLRSSSTGKVSFTKYWAKGQSVTEGERVLTIIPEDTGEIIGKIALDMKRSGKVKQGQKINIKFDNYPYLEYGMVEGAVNKISLVPAENIYTVEVSLVDGLRTFYGVELEFTQEMQGTAEIITEKRRLLKRLVDPIKFIFEKNASYRQE
ncbi:MAG: HlyD family efflux transporter periplasmic adaptor subunit, partial [Bacteroidetes bacterium]|nr:HlyD family efflux transporter periplasmic adaptor subunit [Bacteroidota bacterium]